MKPFHHTPHTKLTPLSLILLGLINTSFAASFTIEDLKGTYVGGYLGGGWGVSDVTTETGPTNGSSYLSPLDSLAVNNNGSDTLHPNTVVGGIQANNNWTYKNFLYGIALDYGAFHYTQSHDTLNTFYPGTPVSYSIQTAIKTNWLFTLRGRLGMKPTTNWPLLYGTGGLAVTDFQVSNDFGDQNSPCFAQGGTKKTKTKTGWTAGGGIEFPILNNFTINAEYLYVNFNSLTASSRIANSNICFTSPVGTISNPFKTTANFYSNLFRVALNYKFI